MPKITLVIPTYNVEAYIRTCLDSLVRQTSHDFVALVVNDGSPANEQAIIDEYTAQYAFIQSIQKPNGGYGSVLNTAIQHLTTPYFLICDPDDYLREDAVEMLIKLIETNEADLVIGAKNLVFSDNQEIKYDPSFNPDFAQLEDGGIYVKGSPAFDQLFFVEPSPHAKLYRSEMVKKIKFPEKVSYTDNLLYYLCLLQSRRVVYTKEAFSYYLINREGNTRTDLRPQVMVSWMTVLTEILKQSASISDVPEMFYYRMFESFKFVFNKIDAIQADESILKERLFETQNLLKLLLPHRDAILNQYRNLSVSVGKERRHDLELLDPRLSDRRFEQLAHRKLHIKVHGGFGLKDKIKQTLQSNAFFTKIYDIYHEQAKYIYASKNPKSILHPSIDLKVIDPIGQTFFGYYNRSPYRNGHYIYHRLHSSILSLKQPIEICLDGRAIGSSSAWNWQQGSLLQWIDDRRIIHNFFDGDYKSKIIDIESLQETIIDYPIYTVADNGLFALSLNFKRLAKYRPDYGYFNLGFHDVPPLDEKDGIFYVDLACNTQRLLISLAQMAQFESEPSMKDAIHKVNHIDLSPNHENFIFLHRWIKEGVKRSRLIRADVKTAAMTVVASYGMVSHCFWEDDETIIGYLKGPQGDRYYRIDAQGMNLILKNLVDDGHPSISNQLCVADAYPDHTCTSKVYLAKAPYDQATEIARFYSGRRYKGVYRCDLHPRFSPGQAEVTLDTVHSGRRQLVVLSIERWLKP